jgi:hypothetical protein
VTYPALDLYPSEVTFPSSGSFSWDTEGAGVQLGGQILTGTAPDGTNWFVFDPISGWDGSSASSLQLTQKTRAPGGWTGPRNLTPRHLTLSGLIDAPTVDAAVAAADALVAAAGLDATILTVARGTQARSVIAYRQGEVDVSPVTDTRFSYSLDLICPDPRKFTTALTAGTGLPSSSGGVTVPLVVPVTVASTSVAGAVSLTNPGNAVGPVVVRIDGPCSGPMITHVGSGLQLVFQSTLVLAAGEWLEVDMEAQTALANGQSSRNSFITGRGWSGFDPGANTWRVDSALYDPAALFTVTATPAWQ